MKKKRYDKKQSKYRFCPVITRITNRLNPGNKLEVLFGSC